ncbi:MAG: hypothetical protein AAGF84_04880 [Planctomycetota bacterium]
MAEAPSTTANETETEARAPAATADTPTHVRETRPDDVADALMFVSAAGIAVDAALVDHGSSHLCHRQGETERTLVGVAVVSQADDQPICVTLHDDDAGVTARKLLDTSLMKLGSAGQRMLRVQSPEPTAEKLWPEPGWLGRLPDLNEQAQSRRWEDALDECPACVIDVVQRALAKAESALRQIDGDASADETDES